MNNSITNYVSNGIQLVDQSLIALGITIENWARETRDCPQHKYLTRPVYKFFATRTGSVTAVAISFLSVDLIIHQILAQSVSCLSRQALHFAVQKLTNEELPMDDQCQLSWYPLATCLWFGLATPVMYVKYKRRGQEITNPINQD